MFADSKELAIMDNLRAPRPKRRAQVSAVVTVSPITQRVPIWWTAVTPSIDWGSFDRSVSAPREECGSAALRRR